MPYFVVNTHDHTNIAGPFGTPEEATAEMYARFPVVEPWDGVEVPVGVVERPSLFPLGQVVGTPGALKVMDRLGVGPLDLLLRHQLGDWGNIHPEDRGLNEEAIATGARIFSVYGEDDDCLWVITEADRSSTTILRLEDY